MNNLIKTILLCLGLTVSVSLLAYTKFTGYKADDNQGLVGADEDAHGLMDVTPETSRCLAVIYNKTNGDFVKCEINLPGGRKITMLPNEITQQQCENYCPTSEKKTINE